LTSGPDMVKVMGNRRLSTTAMGRVVRLRQLAVVGL
jgi:hypothetical protein